MAGSTASTPYPAFSATRHEAALPFSGPLPWGSRTTGGTLRLCPPSGVLLLEGDDVRVHARPCLHAGGGDQVPLLVRAPEQRGPRLVPVALVGQRRTQAPVQSGRFTEADRQVTERGPRGLEDVGVGPEGDGGPASGRRPCRGGRGDSDAACVLLDPASPSRRTSTVNRLDSALTTDGSVRNGLMAMV